MGALSEFNSRAEWNLTVLSGGGCWAVFVYAFGQVIQIMVNPQFIRFIDCECWGWSSSHFTHNKSIRKEPLKWFVILLSEWRLEAIVMRPRPELLLIWIHSIINWLMNSFLLHRHCFFMNESACSIQCPANAQWTISERVRRWALGSKLFGHGPMLGWWTAGVHLQLVIHHAVAEIALSNAVN